MKARTLFLAVPLMALVACRDNLSVQIQAICFPTSDCTFSSTCDAQLLGNPVVIGGAASLTLFFQVANQVSNNADTGTGKVNTHDAHVEQAIVSGSSFPMTATWVPAQGSAVVGVELPASAGQIELQMSGHFADGTSFTTAEFPIVIGICSACTATCPAGQIACPGPGQLPFTCFDPGFEPTTAGTI